MTLRCAIYTRKSSEEGLGQDFNSLHAQREACKAFITSQKHEGWQIIKSDYDDGGFSGGNIMRPGLQKLLKDIEERKVNVVVVYKVDRLTRSLADFAKIIEQFDKQDISFVSVTQQFNTTSSMGRLTLNVLLSFAQFEREVTGERIRDKIAASKQKGMFMGGNVSLGYEVKDRKLRIVPEDAKTVRHIFRRYLELGCIRLLHNDLKTSGIRSKRKGAVMSRGALHNMLVNNIYIGKIRHKNLMHDGLHEPIIDQALWDQVQQRMAANRIGVKTSSGKVTPNPLAGKLFAASGERLVPVRASKQGRRYRYYVSQRLTTDTREEAANSWRLPAQEIETTIARAAARMLSDDVAITPILHKAGLPVHRFPALRSAVADLRQRLNSACGMADALSTLVERVELRPDGLKLTIRLAPFVGEKLDNALHPVMTKDITMRMQRRGVEVKLIINGGNAAKPDCVLIKAVARARIWVDELVSGQVNSIREISQCDKVSESYVGNLLPLAFLAPDIVEAILAGRQPPMLTLETLTKQIDLPCEWVTQRKLLT